MRRGENFSREPHYISRCFLEHLTRFHSYLLATHTSHSTGLIQNHGIRLFFQLKWAVDAGCFKLRTDRKCQLKSCQKQMNVFCRNELSAQPISNSIWLIHLNWHWLKGYSLGCPSIELIDAAGLKLLVMLSLHPNSNYVEFQKYSFLNCSLERCNLCVLEKTLVIIILLNKNNTFSNER